MRAEQEDFLSLTTRQDRRKWVERQVPVKKPSKHGCMVAGGGIVCNAFFSRFFGVSHNLIEASKGNPAALARR